MGSLATITEVKRSCIRCLSRKIDSMQINHKIAFMVFMVTTCGCIVRAYPRVSLSGARYARPASVEELFDGYPLAAEELDELRLGNNQRKRSEPEHFSRMNRRQELTNLYGKIVKEFPFLANQGLLRPDDRKVSIDDLLSMSVFGQPKMGKK